jgi:uncharacterized protein (TIGR00369 family)
MIGLASQQQKGWRMTRTSFVPRDPGFAGRVEASFGRQAFMGHLGVELVRVAPGEVDLMVPFHEGLTQQHGFFHAGVAATIADSAAGYAALSLFSPGTGILTTEFKINFLAPARGERLVARGRAVKSGRTLTVCQSEVAAVSDGAETLVAIGLFTLMQVAGLED